MMKKLVTKSRKLGPKRCKLVFEDSINQLPDDLLATILSLLTIKEAARTSVLSHRWEKLWNIPTFTGGSIMFDYKLSELLPKEHSKFLRRANHVLASLSEASTLDDFSVRCYFDKYSKCHFDRWVEFALEKRVKRLVLDMYPENLPLPSPFLRYTFPIDRIYTMPSRVTSLTSLHLNSVNVSGEIIEYLISNCQFLEDISLKFSRELTDLKVEGATIKLKSLKILYCHNLCSLAISAPNLVSFHYSGPTILKVENAPKLIEAYIGDGTELYVPHSLSNYFSQLETFCMDVACVDPGYFYEPLRLNNLKHLILRAISHRDDGFLHWIELIEACPSLNRLTVELLLRSKRRSKRRYHHPPSTHPCLKLVEIIGFVGCATEVELVMHLLTNSSTLEKIIINRHEPFPSRVTFEESEKNIEAKKYALRLMEVCLLKGLDFVLI